MGNPRCSILRGGRSRFDRTAAPSTAGHRHFAPVDAQRVMHWSNYSAKTVALIQANGMPIE